MYEVLLVGLLAIALLAVVFGSMHAKSGKNIEASLDRIGKRSVAAAKSNAGMAVGNARSAIDDMREMGSYSQAVHEDMGGDSLVTPASAQMNPLSSDSQKYL